jgi:hypothetical protein
MHSRRPAAWIGILACVVMLALPVRTIAADLPVKPAPPSQPAASAPPSKASPLAAPSASCLEWSDGCRTCQRAASGEIACSNVGIACVPKEEQCTRR